MAHVRAGGAAPRSGASHIMYLYITSVSTREKEIHPYRVREFFRRTFAMMDTEIEEARDFWNGVAEDWRIQVGDEGDSNRRLNSDPVLWAFAGDVRGLEVLDAGCGTGYLTNRLSERGALVTGIDFSERMIAIAQDTTPAVDFRVDSCSELRTIGDEHFDMVIANYVFMDTPDLHGAVQPRSKTGRGGGAGLLPSVFSGRRCHSFEGRRKIPLRLGLAILPRKEMHRPPWGHFTSDFIWFHRPLSEYWKAFTAAGFDVVDFEEPRITEDRYHLAKTEKQLRNAKTRPYSVAFKLQKQSGST